MIRERKDNLVLQVERRADLKHLAREEELTKLRERNETLQIRADMKHNLEEEIARNRELRFGGIKSKAQEVLQKMKNRKKKKGEKKKGVIFGSNNSEAFQNKGVFFNK